MSETDNQGYGFMQPGDAGSRFNVLQFLIRQALAEVRTAIPVVVKAVTTSGGLSPIGTVDVSPLVNILDGNGNATKHHTIFGVSYFRLQGGRNAVIIDPVVGDLGEAIINDRDISAVKSALAQANPGSGRRFDLADATYFGCTMSGSAPNQYVQFTQQGVTIADANGNTIAMSSAGISLNGVVIDKNGNLTAPGSAQISVGTGVAAVTLTQHIHAANNTPPTPGH